MTEKVLKIIHADINKYILKQMQMDISQIVPQAELHSFVRPDAALEFAKANGCDVLLTEVEFLTDRLGGFRLAKSIKELYPQVNIIFVTVWNEYEISRELSGLKFNGIIHKPWRQEKLSAALQELLHEENLQCKNGFGGDKVSEENEKQGGKHSAQGGIVLKKRHIAIIIILVLLLICGGIFVGLNWNNWFGEKENAPVQTSQSDTSVDLDPNAGIYDGSKPEDKEPSAKGIKIPGYPSITIAADTQNVTMALLNPEGNPCYFKFEIVLKDTNETIYESKYVEPGKAISDVELAKPLSAGEYPAIIKISTLSLDGKSPMNGANVETVLIAK